MRSSTFTCDTLQRQTWANFASFCEASREIQTSLLISNEKRTAMKPTLIVVSLLLVGFCHASNILDLEDKSEAVLFDSFSQYIQEHNKNYETEEEHLQRFKNYKASLIRIEKQNQLGGATFGINKFSDMSPEEFASQYLNGNFPSTSELAKKELKRVNTNDPFPYPERIDWRDKNVVTPVKDQQKCGCCWAFSAVETIESTWMIFKNLTTSNFPTLSVQEVLDCTPLGGCQGGFAQIAYNWVMRSKGLVSDAKYPYTARVGRCACANCTSNDGIAGIRDWYKATVPGNERHLLVNLQKYSPISIAVHAGQSWQDYKGGIMTRAGCGIGPLNHALQLVGFVKNGDHPYWIARNQWGTIWGEQGYIRLTYGGDTCKITHMATVVEVTH
eukprot:TRINITY_DN388_c0_g1_i1.p1 TRINITY_DN388_c0_g1~~TRINITY_DN388_c0_g1_i1.p1  ORF type:complete len:386 (-),score=51.74 TRINITY_DN388_c0_g1_i1:230-1387(-)